MPITKNNGGDVLARGGVRARFMASEVGTTDEKWNSIFEDFDAEKFKKEGLPKVKGDKKETNRVR